MSSSNDLATLRLSIEQALLGEVTSRLQAVTCGVQNRSITVRAYFRGSVTEQDVERIEMVGTEVIAHFPGGYMIKEECQSVDGCEAEMLDFWAFIRADD